MFICFCISNDFCRFGVCLIFLFHGKGTCLFQNGRTFCTGKKQVLECFKRFDRRSDKEQVQTFQCDTQLCFFDILFKLFADKNFIICFVKVGFIHIQRRTDGDHRIIQQVFQHDRCRSQRDLFGGTVFHILGNDRFPTHAIEEILLCIRDTICHFPIAVHNGIIAQNGVTIFTGSEGIRCDLCLFCIGIIQLCGIGSHECIADDFLFDNGNTHDFIDRVGEEPMPSAFVYITVNKFTETQDNDFFFCGVDDERAAACQEPCKHDNDGSSQDNEHGLQCFGKQLDTGCELSILRSRSIVVIVNMFAHT